MKPRPKTKYQKLEDKIDKLKEKIDTLKEPTKLNRRKADIKDSDFILTMKELDKSMSDVQRTHLLELIKSFQIYQPFIR